MGLSGFLKRRVKYFIKGSCWCCCGGGGMVGVVGTLGVVVSTILVVLSALTTPSSVSASACKEYVRCNSLITLLRLLL